MGGRFLDYMAQGAAADRPDAVDMPSRIAPGSCAIYYATDTDVFNFFNADSESWTELNIAALGTPQFQTLADVDWTTPPTDGQTFKWDAASSKIVPITIPAGMDAEQVQDIIGATVINGTGITVDYDDAAGTVEITSNVTQYTDENAMDIIASMIAAGVQTGISIVYDDTLNSLSFAVATQYSDADADARIAAASVGDLNDVDTTTTAPVEGDTLVWRTSQFVPEAPSGGGGGGNPWTLAGSWSWSVNVAQVDFTGLGAFSELLIVVRKLAGSTNSVPNLQLSTDNGVSFHAGSTDYELVQATGVITTATSVALNTTGSTAPRSAVASVEGINLNGVPKTIDKISKDDGGSAMFVGSLAPVDAIRIAATSPGSFTAGDIYVLGR